MVKGVPAASLAYHNPSGVLHDSDENSSGGEENEPHLGEFAGAADDQAVGAMGVTTERQSGDERVNAGGDSVGGGGGGGTSGGDNIRTRSSRFR